jgi:hypothetical protein
MHARCFVSASAAGVGASSQSTLVVEEIDLREFILTYKHLEALHESRCRRSGILYDPITPRN